MISQRPLLQFINQNRVPVAVLAITAIVALYLASKIIFDVVRFNDPRYQDQALRNWMTPQYVMKSYDLPRAVVDDIFELTPEHEQRRKMRFIAQSLNLNLTELTERVRLRAKAYRDSL